MIESISGIQTLLYHCLQVEDNITAPLLLGLQTHTFQPGRNHFPPNEAIGTR